MPCLMALGIFDMRWPPYAADLTLELYQHRHTNKAFVKVSYNGQVRRRLGSFFFFNYILFFDSTHLFLVCAGSAYTRL